MFLFNLEKWTKPIILNLSKYTNLQLDYKELKIPESLSKTQLNYKLSFLICSLYTLVPGDNNFKYFSFEQDIILNMTNNSSFHREVKKIYEMYHLLNNVSIRRFTYFLVKPILNEEYLNKSFFNNGEEVNEQTIFLKKYLKKFKYNYRRHFYYKNGSHHDFPTNKEMNTYAIEYLFLLTSV